MKVEEWYRVRFKEVGKRVVMDGLINNYDMVVLSIKVKVSKRLYDYVMVKSNLMVK